MESAAPFLAVGVALILVLVFAVYVRFFPTPLNPFPMAERFTAATLTQPATGTSRHPMSL